MPLRVPVTATVLPDWIRKCAGTVNELIGLVSALTTRVEALEAPLPGPFADDAAAATGGVAVNSAYRKTGGTVAWRVS